MDETNLIELYMQMTGCTESAARAVLMHVLPGEDKRVVEANNSEALPDEGRKPEPAPPPAAIYAKRAVRSFIIFACLGLALMSGAAEAPPRRNTIITSPMALADAINIALRQNPSILRAQKDLEATQGVVIQTRAIVFPRLAATGSYSAAEEGDIDTLTVPGVTFGNNQNWATQLKLVQSIYEGGRMLSSLRVARLAKEKSLLNYRTVVADAVLVVQLAYYRVLLAADQIKVQEASIELLTRELVDTQRRLEAGTVPRFNVLRAEVELANARPRLITARNSFRVSKNNLATLLGFDIPQEAFEDIPLHLAGKLDDEPFEIDLPRAINLALDRRTELEGLRKTQALSKEDVINAKAGYFPSVQAFAGYDVHNSVLTRDLTVERHGWIAGAQLTWNLFDGLRTRGRLVETTANYERAGIELEDAGRKIELEVRTAYSNFIEAREVIESQKKVIEAAVEALRLARARAEAGSGTQLDVLSAQTALTDARTTQVQALHDYDAARARLQRAVGMNWAAPDQH